MATTSIVTLLFCICFSFTIPALSARNLQSFPLDNTPQNANCPYICHPNRFADLGLDMSMYAFCDKKLPYHVRAKSLVDQMTLWEKTQQIGSWAAGVPRLGIPPYIWWNEGLHGIASSPGVNFNGPIPNATSFPTVILMAAAFNESLWKSVGEAVSTEGRAIYNSGQAGLTFWAPNINIIRDPRWGRSMETPGEDPFTVGRYAVNFVRGMQDIEGTHHVKDLNSRPLKVSACCKHWAAYDLDVWNGVDRYSFNALVKEQDLIESFSPPFEMCIKEGDASGLMCSYNRVNGIPSCANPKLLNETIRGEWDLHGCIVSDCYAIRKIVTDHKFLGDTPEDAVAQTLKAGTNVDCGYFLPQYAANATVNGKVREGDIDKALNILYLVLMRVGYFDGNPAFDKLGKKDVCTDEHTELALEAARQGIVLLKNENQTLPLNAANFKNVTLAGPHANATVAMLGNYAGIPCCYRTPVDGFSSYTNVNYEMGCADVACKNNTFIFHAMEAAKVADATIIVVGLDVTVEAEEKDRTDLLLPGYQTQLVNRAAELAKGPVILIVMCGGAVDISFAKDNSNIKAILWAGYPGEQGGQALADIVFGIYNPGGRLPATWYKADYVNKLPMTSMQLRPDESLSYPGRTYRFFEGTTVFPFAFGLSYTRFSYQLRSAKHSLTIKLPKYVQCHNLIYKSNTHRRACPGILISDMPCDKNLEFKVEVRNVGKMLGDEVIMVYSKAPVGIVGTPIKQVIGFQRVKLAPGKGEKVKFKMNACRSLSIVDYKGYSLLPSGEHTIIVGDAAITFPVHVSFRY
ncbi:hypothetical protein Ancab_018304 [Ancistrocladus abbreviatus]